MKFRLFLIVGLTLAFSSFNFSQAKQISANEFYTSNSNAAKLLDGRSWRMELKTETLENGAVTKSVVNIEENLPPDKMRFLTIEKTGEQEVRRELIRIHYMEYRRLNNEPWTAIDLRKTGGYGSGSGIGGGSSCVQFTEETDFVSGVPARKLGNYLIETTSEGLSFSDYHTWLNQEGLFLKTERIKGLLEPHTEKLRAVTIYEYDPKITIEAPIK